MDFWRLDIWQQTSKKLLGFGMGMTFACFYLFGKYDSFSLPLNKKVKNTRALRESFFNKKLMIASPPGGLPLLSFCITPLISRGEVEDEASMWRPPP
jgi:hypothetical protein